MENDDAFVLYRKIYTDQVTEALGILDNISKSTIKELIIKALVAEDYGLCAECIPLLFSEELPQSEEYRKRFDELIGQQDRSRLIRLVDDFQPMPTMSSKARDVLVNDCIYKLLSIFIEIANRYYTVNEFEVNDATIPCMRRIVAAKYGVEL